MNRILLFSLFCLLIVLPIRRAPADVSVTWIRTGVMLEVQDKSRCRRQSSASQLCLNGVAHKLAEAPTVTHFNTQFNSKRILLQFPWQPNEDYQFHFRSNDIKITATSPLKPTPYRISTVELDGLLSLMENLRQPAKPTAIALGHGKAPYTHKLAVATDSGAPCSPPNTLRQNAFGELGFRKAMSEEWRSVQIIPDSISASKQQMDSSTAIISQPLNRHFSWKYRTADDIETSTPSNPNSVYAWVSYPGPACMRTLATGTSWSRVCIHGHKTIRHLRNRSFIGLTVKSEMLSGSGPATGQRCR